MKKEKDWNENVSLGRGREKKNQKNDVEKFIDFKMSSGSEGEREREACKWWGHGERVFFLGGKETSNVKRRRRDEEKQTITLQKVKKRRQKDGGNWVITASKPPQKVYNKFQFLSGWFFPQLRLKIQDCGQKKIMWTYYSHGEKSESRVLKLRGDKKVSNPAQQTIDSISHSGPFLASVMVI